MDNIIKSMNLIFSFIATIVTWIFGGWNISIIVLISFMALDYITGILKAYISNNLSSSIGIKGIAKKGLILIVLIVGSLLDRLINSNEWIFRTLICYFYISNEGLSLLENCALLGLPLPDKLLNSLKQLQEKK
ncbi:Holin family [Clostridium bornimense]|uniref:Holin family n=1 Tax=Clostridium bornimense TaxID=1216932 RepID=W6SKH0_9CLOT|nr:phage holin family protein [Clostridium bornimense]CDM70370.1 Holin family [Clostridium bornimense]